MKKELSDMKIELIDTKSDNKKLTEELKKVKQDLLVEQQKKKTKARALDLQIKKVRFKYLFFKI